MSSVKWTEDQEKAINTRNTELLLSAAAGSGKTAVLVERIVSLITDKENPVSPEELVVLTFSRAAAAEMKQRLIKRMIQEEKHEKSVFLRNQRRLLNHAQISTVHVFCKNIISDNFFSLGISPDFRVADEKESSVIFEDSLTKAIEENYEKGDKDFFELVDLISEGRDDRLLRKTLSALYKNIRSYPFYLEWMKERLMDFDFGGEIGKSVWGKVIFSEAENKVKYALGLLNFAEEIAKSDGKVYEKYSGILGDEIHQAEKLNKICEERNWNDMREALDRISFARMPAIKKCENPVAKERAKELRDSAKNELQNLRDAEYFCSSEDFLRDNAYIKKLMSLIFSLIKDVDRIFSEEKARKKILDFSDLEHYALKLLVTYGENGYETTDYAKFLSQKYKEILVDEYQDTNLIQEMIFKSISDGGKRMFMVGDIKQSIYGFRQARPELFLEKKNLFKNLEAGEEQKKAKIVLSKNFRSCKEVTEGINFIFKLIMSEKSGGIDYGEEDSLIYNENGKFAMADRGCEFVVLDTKSMSGDDFVARENEASYVAERIKEMLESGCKVTDKEGERPLRCSDIAVLMRSVKGKADIYQSVFKKAGLSVIYSGENEFLDSFEISAVMSLLKAIDNPLLDNELFAALMSPMFGFTADEMAEISVNNKDKPLYLRLSDKKDEMPKCKKALEIMEELKRNSVSMSVCDLLIKIYNITSFETLVRVMPGGKVRSMNLKLLTQYAQESDDAGMGLGGFISFVNKLSESDRDFPSAQVSSETQDAVKIMSIHASKGLEFPVVFLVDTASKFNKMDLRENTVLHPKMGFASKRRDMKLGVKFNTVHYDAVNLEKKNDLLSEEMRVLYVALTRAKEKLIITASVSNPETLVKKLNVPLKNKKIPDGLILSRECYADWILSALLHHEYGLNLCAVGETEQIDTLDNEGPFQIRILQDRTEIKEEEINENEESSACEDMLEILRDRVNFVYEDEAMTETPTKFAISSIGRESDISKAFEKRPKFIQEKELTGAEKGNALHKFMQFADYSNLKHDIKGEIERLLEKDFISQKEAEVLNVYKIRKFAESSLFKRIMSADKVYREYDFLAEVGNDVLGEYTDLVKGDCKVTVQGIADCIIIENGSALVIDYKTDFAKSEEELIEKYKTQLLLYKKLLSDSLGCEVKESVIYSFFLDKEIFL